MKRLRALLALVIVVGAFYVAWNVIPPYFNNYQLQDEMESQARMNSYTQATEEDIRKSIYKKVTELEIPIPPEQIHVTRQGQEVAIWTDYRVHVDLPLHPLDLEFHPGSKNRPPGEKGMAAPQ